MSGLFLALACVLLVHGQSSNSAFADYDAYIRDGSYADTVMTGSRLEVKNDATPNYSRKAYFQLTASCPAPRNITNPVLYLNFEPQSYPTGNNVTWTFALWLIKNNDPLDTSSITWNNAPGNDANSGSSLDPNYATKIKTFTISGLSELVALTLGTTFISQVTAFETVVLALTSESKPADVEYSGAVHFVSRATSSSGAILYWDCPTACDASCVTCSTYFDPSKCTSCGSGITLYNGYCCETGCSRCTSNNFCTSCKSGYTLSGGDCLSGSTTSSSSNYYYYYSPSSYSSRTPSPPSTTAIIAGIIAPIGFIVVLAVCATVCKRRMMAQRRAAALAQQPSRPSGDDTKKAAPTPTPMPEPKKDEKTDYGNAGGDKRSVILEKALGPNSKKAGDGAKTPAFLTPPGVVNPSRTKKKEDSPAASASGAGSASGSASGSNAGSASGSACCSGSGYASRSRSASRSGSVSGSGSGSRRGSGSGSGSRMASSAGGTQSDSGGSAKPPSYAQAVKGRARSTSRKPSRKGSKAGRKAGSKSSKAAHKAKSLPPLAL